MYAPPGVGRGRSTKALAAAVSVLFLAACSGAPEEDTYAIANGVNADIGDVEVRSLLIVSAAESEPGRLLGTLFNKSPEAVEVSIADADDKLAVTVEGGASHGFDTNPAVLNSVEDIPGSRVTVDISVGPEKEELQVPVLDGTLDAYRPYLPQ
ncbi:hypothetical protein [Pseudarthrobacter sp. NamE5]|uniref:hypothetical protein n=1 Tax=Pseudarthrobacter sp. NamE5 TaxID=2576839 RepID=UPI00110A5E69|nr:hypothetical protein [Pseudarthrobacter sp. NamE5]TLM84707.1 hypothetical protein FDW84_11370 [Pseudarthrobacter sp. NamE5]